MREHRVRGHDVVHPGGKDLFRGGFTDIQHVPQVLDLFSSAVSGGEGGVVHIRSVHMHFLVIHIIAWKSI